MTDVATIPDLPRAKASSPNIVFILLDDVGFGAPSITGGPVNVPTLETLTGEGLTYTRFHTTAICSPTRASLLTGRDAHVANVGTVMNSSFRNPGYQGRLSDSTATVARILNDAGYATSCFGKWHLAPAWETSPLGPFDRWPTGVGFDHFYGFLGGETDQYDPTLYQGTSPVLRPEGDDYHVTEDIVTRSIDWIRMQNALRPDQPFFTYLATGATHAPLQVPLEYADRYAGQFADGWDVMRGRILARQIEMGILPEGTQLTPRPAELPAWDSLSSDERRVAERMMEVYAGFLEHTDVQLGRLVAALKEDGLFENTIFAYIVGDNGGSSEGGLPGSINYVGALQGMQESLTQQIDSLGTMGAPGSFVQYPAGWAWAMSSPFQWVKQVASHFGGIRNPLVLTWPERITQPGMRTQFSHVNDLVPTVLEAAGVSAPEVVRGVEQAPMDGTSLSYSFDDPDAPEQHTTQYFEVFGHRSIYHEGWMASAFHRAGMPWTVGGLPQDVPVEDDVWELYDTRTDPSQANDLAAVHPERLAKLRARFDQEAERVGISPIRDARVHRGEQPSLATGRTDFTFKSPVVGIPETNGPAIAGRSWRIAAQVEIGSETPTGVLVTMGGQTAGMALHVDALGRPVFDQQLFALGHVQLVGETLTAGEHTVELEFIADKPGVRGTSGCFVLRQDGQEIAREQVPQTVRAFYSIDETVNIGANTGSPVGDYIGAHRFTGRLRQVDWYVSPTT